MLKDDTAYKQACRTLLQMADDINCGFTSTA